MKKILSCEPYSINYLGREFSLRRCRLDTGEEVFTTDLDNLIQPKYLQQMLKDGFLRRLRREVFSTSQGLSRRMLYDVAADVPPSKYCVNAIKEEKNMKRFFYGVPEEMFLEAVQYSVARCGWASVGLIKGYLARKGIAASRRGVAARLKTLRERGMEIP